MNDLKKGLNWRKVEETNFFKIPGQAKKNKDDDRLNFYALWENYFLIGLTSDIMCEVKRGGKRREWKRC